MEKKELEKGLFSENAVVSEGKGQVESAVNDSSTFGVEITINSDGQLSLFGPDLEDAKKVDEKKGKSAASTKAESKVGKKSAPKTSAAALKPKLEKVPLSEPESWTVHYAGQTYIVNTLFEEEIADGKTEATLDEIREKLATAEGCVELTQARTKWDAEEEQKRLFPVAFGTSKGGC
jgi:hypothetical protein